MDLVLYIQIKEQNNIGFGIPLANWFREEMPGLNLIDADNYSDDLVINQELKMIQESSSCVLLIDADTDAKPGKTVKLIEALLRGKGQQVLVHLKGGNSTLEKMLKLGKRNFHQNLTDSALKQLILAAKR